MSETPDENQDTSLASALGDFSGVSAEPVERICLECDEPFMSRYPRRICDDCIARHEQRVAAGFVAKTTSSIPDGYAGADFETGAAVLRERVKPESAIRKAAQCRGHMVMLVGPSGAGKTTLACAMLRQRAKRMVGMFVTSAQLGHEAGLFTGRESELLRRARSRAVLLLDDLGTEIDRSQRLEASHAVGNIIQERHDRQLVTIATTFRSDEELEARYGDGVLRRLFSNIVIRLGGAS
jgi:hypothetical protein